MVTARYTADSPAANKRHFPIPGCRYFPFRPYFVCCAAMMSVWVHRPPKELLRHDLTSAASFSTSPCIMNIAAIVCRDSYVLHVITPLNWNVQLRDGCFFRPRLIYRRTINESGRDLLSRRKAVLHRLDYCAKQNLTANEPLWH